MKKIKGLTKVLCIPISQESNDAFARISIKADSFDIKYRLQSYLVVIGSRARFKARGPITT